MDRAIIKVGGVLKSLKTRLIICELVWWMGSYEKIFGTKAKKKWIVNDVVYDLWVSCV